MDIIQLPKPPAFRLQLGRHIAQPLAGAFGLRCRWIKDRPAHFAANGPHCGPHSLACGREISRSYGIVRL